MTAPPKKQVCVNCENKRRYTDEFTARAGVQSYMQSNPTVPEKLWIYACNLCHGWHMTSSGRGRKWLITRDEMFHESMREQQELLEQKLFEIRQIDTELARLNERTALQGTALLR